MTPSKECLCYVQQIRNIRLQRVNVLFIHKNVVFFFCKTKFNRKISPTELNKGEKVIKVVSKYQMGGREFFVF